MTLSTVGCALQLLGIASAVFVLSGRRRDSCLTKCPSTTPTGPASCQITTGGSPNHEKRTSPTSMPRSRTRLYTAISCETRQRWVSMETRLWMCTRALLGLQRQSPSLWGQSRVLSEVPTSFTITVTSDAGENDETIEVTLQFTYVEKYPDEVPLWEIYSQENLEDSDAEGILTLLQQQAEENLGMVMIFTLVTAVQDKLNELVDEIKNRREEEKRRKEEAAEEAEKVLFQGTVVTIENFLSWKAKFELEMAELRRKRQKEEEQQQAGKIKLTGKKLFETDHNLDTSDIQFLEDSGNSVEVDESLFQDLEELDLDEDDPDFDPLALGSDED
uniref:RWD domain-containing protein 1 n=1 Tax=Oncorhynchus kisutch TaxID=8019 RepID=A0A8C7CKV5_ONCKI